jgi:hypothetical protein
MLTRMYKEAEARDVPITRAIVYDDACHLMQYVMNRMHVSLWARLMASLVYRLDNFHRVNHRQVARTAAA